MLRLLFIFPMFFCMSVVSAQKKKKNNPKKKEITQRIFINQTLYKELNPSAYKRFKDSIFKHTTDTLTRKDKRTVVLSPTAPISTQEQWVPSTYVFTNAKGNLAIELPNTQLKRYSLLIYDGKTLLHNITNLQEDKWVVEKSNFYRRGWYEFELYCNGELLEKNKFYLQ